MTMSDETRVISSHALTVEGMTSHRYNHSTSPPDSTVIARIPLNST